MQRIPRILLLGWAVTAALCPAGAEPWPYWPFNQPHGLGNHFGEYQNYGGSPYYHDGIDLVTPTGPMPTHSVSDGTLTHISYGDPYYSGLMIGEPIAGGVGWLYWHISSGTMQFDVGDPVAVNDYVGTTAYWPVYSFHHVHFNRVRGTGGYPWGWYTAIGNPLEFMEPHPDPTPPVFEPAYQGRRFGFAAQGSGTVLNPDALSGSVDVIAKIGDVVGLPQWRLNPWRIEYRIVGATQSVPPTLSATFTGQIPPDATVGVIYRTLEPMRTQGDYDYRDFYFIVTNTDGDGVVESTDAGYAWNTAAGGAGDYWVYVTAHDLGGNAVSDSMRCTVAGIVNPDIFLPETDHDFGAIPPGGSGSWPMAVRNLGIHPLSVRTVTSDSPRFTADRSHFFVAPGGEETVTVTFSPLDPEPYAATLELTSNDPDEPTVLVSLQGQGGDPSAVAASEAPAAELRILGLSLRPGAGVEVRFEQPAPAAVSAGVFDPAGRCVRAAELGPRAAGPQSWTWDGRDAAGARLSSGIYFIRLAAGGRAARATGMWIR